MFTLSYGVILFEKKGLLTFISGISLKTSLNIDISLKRFILVYVYLVYTLNHHVSIKVGSLVIL